MDNITLNFDFDLNVSLQGGVGDVVYFVDSQGVVYKIGNCVEVFNKSVTCETEPTYLRPSQYDYIFFAKDTESNTSGIVGYYAAIDFEATSTDKVELYAVNAEVFESRPHALQPPAAPPR